MSNFKYTTFIFLSAIPLILYSNKLLWTLYYLLITIIAIISGIIGAIWMHIKLSPRHETGVTVDRYLKDLNEFRDDIQKKQKEQKPAERQRLVVIFGRTVDGLIQQLLDLILWDYIYVWFKDNAFQPENLIISFKGDLWGAIKGVHDRLQRVDHTKLIAVDLLSKVTYHFEKIRIAQSVIAETNRPPVFILSSHLMSAEEELDYLRKISELLIITLLPKGYSLSPAKYVLREIFALKVLQPAINCITDPDYINQKIVNYIEAQQAAAEMYKKTYEYASSFEDFIKYIESTKDVDVLKHMRYNIMTEIMQATTMQNIKRAKGVDPDVVRSSNMPSGIGKADIVAAQKLKRYISQLTYAKIQCDKHLKVLGWDGGILVQDEIDNMIPLSTILENPIGRKYLSLFLETVASQGLVGYWCAAEDLRSAHRNNLHQMGADIFYEYIRSPTAEIKVDRKTRKSMEAFLLGDEGPDAFFKIQKTVFNTLKNKYYQQFTISPFYKQMIDALNAEDTVSENEINFTAKDFQTSSDSSGSDDSYLLNIGDHWNDSKRKLTELQEKLNNKIQALQALRSSLKPDSKVIVILEKEIEWLQGETRQREAHINRADVWSENLGKWRAIVQSVEIPEEKEAPQFVIVVHMIENSGENGEEGISSGWVVFRTLAHFQELHRKLRLVCSGIKYLELPSTNSFKMLFGKVDNNSLEKAKCQVQKYLEYILEDDKLCNSEDVYCFLSPSADHLKYSSSPKKSRFSFATLFKNIGGESNVRTQNSLMLSESNDISQCLDAPGGSELNEVRGMSSNNLLDLDGKEQIAEPLYALMGEIFDMGGVFKFLRRSLITFVQITYGRTISRQIRETISWCFSESMLHYYISLFMKSWWPGGQLASPSQARTRDVKRETAVLARKQFVNNVPEVLCHLVGTQTAKRGALKVFDTLQNAKMNKQLFYDLLEIIVKETFPEIKK